MHAVDDKPIPGVRRFECVRDWSSFPAGQGSHGIEEVREAREPLRHGSSGLPVRCHGMTERYANAGCDELGDESRRHDFGRQGHEQHAVARRRQHRKFVRGRGSDLAWVVHAGFFGR